MLLRQLHRPIARSVAAKRPSSPCPTQRPVLLHGSSLYRQKSLLKQLFPDETTQLNDGPEKEVRWATRLLTQQDEIPSFEVGELSDTLTTAGVIDPELFAENNIDLDNLQIKSVLILSCVSNNLVESDFHRLGAKGKHVEGWVRGIVKVIQMRNPDTLQPVGRYFLLFDRPEAAMAYREEVNRLWRMGKQYVPGAHHSRRSQNAQSLPPSGLTESDDDIISTIRSFTLVPPSQRYNVEMFHPPKDSEQAKASKRLNSVRRGRSFADALFRLCGSRFLVLVRLDGGRVTVDTLRNAIYQDNKDRNLPWRILPSPTSPFSPIPNVGDGESSPFILPFGSSTITSYDRKYEAQMEAQLSKWEARNKAGSHATSRIGDALDRAEQNGKPPNEDDVEASSSSSSSSPAPTRTEATESEQLEEGVTTTKEPGSDQEPVSSPAATNDGAGQPDNLHRYRQYLRFLVPFADESEARRFVREWHRREFTMRSAEGDWEEHRVVNTSMLW